MSASILGVREHSYSVTTSKETHYLNGVVITVPLLNVISIFSVY